MHSQKNMLGWLRRWCVGRLHEVSDGYHDQLPQTTATYWPPFRVSTVPIPSFGGTNCVDSETHVAPPVREPGSWLHQLIHVVLPDFAVPLIPVRPLRTCYP